MNECTHRDVMYCWWVECQVHLSFSVVNDYYFNSTSTVRQNIIIRMRIDTVIKQHD